MSDRIIIEATIRAYAAAWAARDREAWLNTFAASAIQEDPVGSRKRRGRAEIAGFWDNAMAAYDSIEIIPRNFFIIGHEAALEWTINATNAGGQVKLAGIDVFVFDDQGLITSVRAYWEKPHAEL